MSSTVIAQEGTETKSRSSLSLGITRFLKARRLYLGFAQLQQNEELDLDFRSLVGGVYGRYLIQNNKTILNLFGGFAVSQERFSGEPALESVEAVGGLAYSMFIFDDPETDTDLSVLVFPNLTTSGRVRTELQARIRCEIAKNLFLALSLYDSFDSKPPSEDSETNDWGVNTSLGWTF